MIGMKNERTIICRLRLNFRRDFESQVNESRVVTSI